MSPEEVRAVVDVFRHPDLCFLTPPWPDPIEPDDRIDISHESLIHHWDRLRDWVLAESRQAEMYRRLDRDAALHAEGEAGLWGPPQLDLALDWKEKTSPNPAWASRYGGNFDQAMAFLDASRRARDEEEARRREAEHLATEEKLRAAEERARLQAEAAEERARLQAQAAEERALIQTEAAEERARLQAARPPSRGCQARSWRGSGSAAASLQKLLASWAWPSCSPSSSPGSRSGSRGRLDTRPRMLGRRRIGRNRGANALVPGSRRKRRQRMLGPPRNVRRPPPAAQTPSDSPRSRPCGRATSSTWVSCSAPRPTASRIRMRHSARSSRPRSQPPADRLPARAQGRR